jgi:hypothetical protein
MKKLVITLLSSLFLSSVLFSQPGNKADNRDWTILEAYMIPGKASGLAWDGTYLYSGTVFSGDDNIIYKIDPVDGSFETQCTAPIDGAYGLTYDETSGHLWTTNHPSANDPGLAIQFDLDGDLVSDFELPATYFSGIAWDNDSFWTSCYYNPDGEVFKVDGSGTVLDQFPTPGQQPWDICIQDEFLWVVDYDMDMIHKIDQTGLVIENYASEGDRPAGIVFDGTYLWYCDGPLGGSSTLYKIDLGGSGNPEINVPVTEHNYGMVTIDETETWLCTIENTGTADLEVTYGDIIGPGAEYINWPVGSFTIGAGEDEQIPFEYTPGEAGPLNAIATLESNDPITPEVEITLTGTAVYDDAYLEILDDDQNYGDVRVDATTRWFLEIRNLGDATLIINQITVDQQQYYVDQGISFPVNIQPLATAQFGIWFSPDSDLDYEATTSIVSNDAYENPNEVSLSGSGLRQDWPIGEVFWSYQLPYDFDISIKGIHKIKDVTGDGVNDVIVCSEDNYIRCFNGNSHGMADLIWEHFVYSGSVFGQNDLVVADLNDDGIEEVIIGTTGGDRSIMAIAGNTGSLIWKFNTDLYGDGGWVYKVDASFDYNGDGFTDVLAATGDDAMDVGPKRVFCLDGLNGDQIWNRNLGGPVFSVIGIHDFNNDNLPDVLAGASNGDESQGFIYGLDGLDGTIEWSKTAMGTSVWALTGLDDVNESGVQDVMAGDFSGNFYIIDPGSEDIIEQGSIGNVLMLRLVKMDDVNEDELADVLVAHSGNRAYILDGANGNAIVDEPLADKCWNVARINDISGDAINDFVAGTLFSSNYAYMMDGATGDELFSQNFYETIDGINTIKDINGDGSMEMVVGGRDGKLVCYSGGLDAWVGMSKFNHIADLKHAVYPNPFHDKTVISFILEQKSHVEISIYDVLGRKIEQIADRQFNKGEHEVAWEYSDQVPAAMAFYYTISIEDKKYSGKVIKMP